MRRINGTPVATPINPQKFGGEQVSPLISGKWYISNPENIKEPIVPAMVRDVEFETTLALYDDGLLLPNGTNKVVSTHEAKCNAIEIDYIDILGKRRAILLYHVERTDDAVMDLITENGESKLLAYYSGNWNCPEAQFVDFGVAQAVDAQFKEAFEAIAVKRETLAYYLVCSSCCRRCSKGT